METKRYLSSIMLTCVALSAALGCDVNTPERFTVNVGSTGKDPRKKDKPGNDRDQHDIKFEFYKSLSQHSPNPGCVDNAATDDRGKLATLQSFPDIPFSYSDSNFISCRDVCASWGRTCDTMHCALEESDSKKQHFAGLISPQVDCSSIPDATLVKTCDEPIGHQQAYSFVDDDPSGQRIPLYNSNEEPVLGLDDTSGVHCCCKS